MKQSFSARIVTLQEVYAASYKLALLIMDSHHVFDTVIAIARGGFPVARFICDFLNIKAMGAIQIKHYLAGAREQGKTEIIAPVNIEVAGRKILLIDDVNDSGKTLIVARDYIQSLHPMLLKTAVIHEKPNTIAQVDFVAEKITEWKWLMYQWAVTEDILGFLHKDNMLEADEEAAYAHLIKKYDLTIDKNYFYDILKLKENYYKTPES
ncbi:phosphoribosyltransferase [Legionella maioricensis]|uniref:Phosphoribosyltransferase n=1 Tax=Legionella maioricensis TaxID=2896528 RepID=A0A9X2D039_9GAMM|nr:phosphoribosyltransferase [Legionella maioricensis]MCL9683625.1 phosphoribosyltransferase [Legionella maioricensis]MCL9687647.1 phosphoribosyltransferase [Legionella maioricensis]